MLGSIWDLLQSYLEELYIWTLEQFKINPSHCMQKNFLILGWPISLERIKYKCQRKWKHIRCPKNNHVQYSDLIWTIWGNKVARIILCQAFKDQKKKPPSRLIKYLVLYQTFHNLTLDFLKFCSIVWSCTSPVLALGIVKMWMVSWIVAALPKQRCITTFMSVCTF